MFILRKGFHYFVHPLYVLLTSQVVLNIFTAVGGHICICTLYSEAEKMY
jgi:hypothetical protein